MSDDNGEIRLDLPAVGEHVQLARLVAAGLASRLDFDYEEIEDLRLAVDELCFAVLRCGAPTDTLALRYRVDPDALVIEGSVAGADGAGLRSLPELTVQILETVVDEYAVGAGDGSASFHLRKQRVPR